MTRVFPVLVLASLVGTAGCSKKLSSDTCPAGKVEVDGKCRQICQNNSHCPAGEICQVNGLCAPGTATAPVLAAIDGTGSGDGAVGHVAHHFADRLLVTGQNLGAASFDLVSAASGPTFNTLGILSASDISVELALPAALGTGEYVLRATNSAGADQATVSILQGEPGPTGPAGPQGVAGPAGPAGAPGGLLALDLELDEVSGSTFADSSVYQNHATAPAAGIAVNSTGHAGAAVNFSGGALIVDNGNTIPDSPQVWLEAWIRPDAPSGTQVVAAKGNAYTLELSGARVRFHVNAGSADCEVITPRTVTANTWHHLQGWYNGLVVAVAVDGVTAAVPCTIGPLLATPGARFHVGGLIASGTGPVTSAFDGHIDELRLRLHAPRSDRYLRCPEGYLDLGSHCLRTTWGSGTYWAAIDACAALGAELCDHAAMLRACQGYPTASGMPDGAWLVTGDLDYRFWGGSYYVGVGVTRRNGTACASDYGPGPTTVRRSWVDPNSTQSYACCQAPMPGMDRAQ